MQEKVWDNLKIAILLRSLRGVLGMSQADFAQWIDVPRSTVTRAESLRLPLRTFILFKIIRMVEEKGIEVDVMSDEPAFKITKKFMESEYQKVEEEK
jgi:DNA-binding XRE family transcriptional regulator